MLCAIIFLADVASGIVSPTFSLFAEGLGVPLAMLGMLSTAGGLAQMGVSLPSGILSDRIGRPTVLLAGLLAFAASLTVMAAAQGLWLLMLSRILMGVAIVATFQTGAAQLGDMTEPAQRPVAFGFYATAMGSGFAVGPLLGSFIAENHGTRIAYLAGAAISLIASALVWVVFSDRQRVRRRAAKEARRLQSGRTMRALLRHRPLMVVSFGNLLISLTFAGTITTFFPIYAAQSGLTQGFIGSMFAVRALVSTMGRLPNGVVSRLIGNRAVLLSALALDMVLMFAIGRTTSAGMLALLLALEGLAFGAYLVSGQTYVADHTAVENRGTAGGIYSTASSIGGTVGPLALGLVASRWGVTTVFAATGWILLVGLGVSVVGSMLARGDHVLNTD